jgi:hypothetical protein
VLLMILVCLMLALTFNKMLTKMKIAIDSVVELGRETRRRSGRNANSVPADCDTEVLIAAP